MRNKERLAEIITKVCQKTGILLYNWQLKGTCNNQSLIVYISKKNGVTLDDCQRLSKELGDELDMRDIFNSRYILEVSSPGLSRYLRTQEHFLGAVGEKVKIHYKNDKENVKTIKGELKSADKSSISVKVNDSESIEILYEQIEKARTVFT